MAQHGVVEFECMFQFVQRGLVALDVHEHVVGLVNFLDHVGELPAAPVFQSVDFPAAGGNHAPVTLDHGGHLLALVRMNDENDLVMPHVISLWVKPPAMGARWSKGFACLRVSLQ